MEQVNLQLSLAQQHMLHKGLKKLGIRGKQAIGKDIGQLHDRTCFKPIHIKEMNADERRKAQVALVCLSKKSNKGIKGQVAFNRKTTQECLGKEDSVNPTTSMELAFLTRIIVAYEGRDIMLADTPNAFIQTLFLREPAEDPTLLKTMGKHVDMLVNMYPDVHKEYMALEKGKRVLCVETLKTMHRMLEAASLWH